jgi:hypothetical protein
MLKLFFTLVFTLFIVPINISAQPQRDSIEIYLLTASPGNETYSAFGHSAIRVYIPSQRINYVYNYGTFDFDTPNFYLKFTTGKLMYFLSIADYERFLNAYNSWGQAIYEQRILLNTRESMRMVQLLNENYQPENRFYRYGFFMDNCATRIRDIFEKSVDGKIVYDSTYITKNETFRQLIEHYLGNTPWTFFGVNLLLGSRTDDVATTSNYMFLPEHLRDILKNSKIISGDSSRSLSASPIELFPSTIVFSKPSPFTSPVTITSILLILTILYSWYLRKNGKNGIWLDRVWFLLTGLLGMLIAALWIWSLHHELQNNYNIIWANPVNLIIGIMLFFKTRPKWFIFLINLYAILLICFLPVSLFIQQSLPAAAYPISGIMIVRSIAIITSQKLVDNK